MNHSKYSGGASLGRYFSSGWAFFIPYLLVYLLYYRLKWPINPLPSGPSAPAWRVPPLLHIYWALHAINLVLAVAAIRNWWRELPVSPVSASGRGEAQRRRVRRSLPSFLPWVLLAALFFIPGVYLEFPSDPWEHFARITLWGHAASPLLYKAYGYFLPYSLIGRTGETRLFFLDIYYTGMSLLLCRHYFQLARAAGLGRRPAYLFVLLQALLFGSSVFSFYRYYGISSSILAQIGAVALTRIGLEAANGGLKDRGAGLPSARISGFVLSAICLLPLIACNHVQGLGIAALGLSAVAIWFLLEWRRDMRWLLPAAAVLLSIAAIRWFPRHPALDAAYRPGGVLTSWYGFAIFSPGSMPETRMLQILGILGLANLAAGALLLRRNRVVGWLTVTPALMLCLPFVAIPFAGVLAHQDLDSIVGFHRMFLAIPAGLALVCLGQELEGLPGVSGAFRLGPFPAVVLALLALTTIPARAPFHNRFWHTLVRTPDDLSLAKARRSFSDYVHSGIYRPDERFAATSESNWVMAAENAPAISLFNDKRTYFNNGAIPASDLDGVFNLLAGSETPKRLVAVSPQPTVNFTAYSFAAVCSGHWLPQEWALGASGAPELRALASRCKLETVGRTGPVLYYGHFAGPDAP